jgi:hypothetical protein
MQHPPRQRLSSNGVIGKFLSVDRVNFLCDRDGEVRPLPIGLLPWIEPEY